MVPSFGAAISGLFRQRGDLLFAVELTDEAKHRVTPFALVRLFRTPIVKTGVDAGPFVGAFHFGPLYPDLLSYFSRERIGAMRG